MIARARVCVPPEGGIAELAPGVHGLGQRKGGRVHAFLVEDGEELTLIDTLYDTDGARVLRQIERIGRRPTDLRHILLTHAHRSHLGGASALREATGAKIYAHEWEADIVAGEREAQRVPLRPKRPYRVYLPFQLAAAVGLGRHPPCPVDAPLVDGDRVGAVHVLHAPGHTAGHLAFYAPDRRVVFAGDAIATWPELSPGWRSFTLNPRRHLTSLRRLAELEADVVAVGHGEPITAHARERVRDLVDSFRP